MTNTKTDNPGMAKKIPRRRRVQPPCNPLQKMQNKILREAAAPSPLAPHNTEGFSYSPPSPQEDTQAYTFHQDNNNLLDKLPIHTPTEYRPIEELVKLNTGTPQQPMTQVEQETFKPSVIYNAQTRLRAYLTKNPDRVLTTEHIRRRTHDGIRYDRNTYLLLLYAQHTLRTVMTVVHEADSDGVHTVPGMADEERYTIRTEADQQRAPDIRNRSYLLLPQATGTLRNHDRRMQRAAIQTEWGGSEDERVDQILRALNILCRQIALICALKYSNFFAMKIRI